MKHRKILSLILAAAMVIGLCACSASGTKSTTTLNVYVANPAMEIMITAAELYHEQRPDIEIKLTTDDGPQLAAQIEAGYTCDIFLADMDYLVDWLDKTADKDANPNKNDCVLKNTRQTLYYGPVDMDLYTDATETDYTTYTVFTVKKSSYPKEAAKFEEFLKSDAMNEALETYGFTWYTEQAAQ